MTALGPVAISRVYLTCFRCGLGAYWADERLGIDGLLSKEARRLVCLAGVQRSFAHAEVLLTEFCGWQVSDERIRQACYEESKAMAAWREAAPSPFPASPPPNTTTEFQTDATKVNTTTGWRDMKIGLFALRPNGPACEASDWLTRTLPAPTARVAFAAIEEIETFQLRWGEWAKRLNLTTFDALHVLADGADWIWNAAAIQFPGHRGVLDIFHACEHLADAAKALHGDGTDAARTWLETTRHALLADGWYGLQDVIGHTLSTPIPESARPTLDAMTAYFAHRQTRLNYRACLARGQAIGSGQIEGACKHMIGRRMKQTGARWTVPNANRMANLTSLSYSGQWADYWVTAA